MAIYTMRWLEMPCSCGFRLADLKCIRFVSRAKGCDNARDSFGFDLVMTKAQPLDGI